MMRYTKFYVLHIGSSWKSEQTVYYTNNKLLSTKQLLSQSCPARSHTTTVKQLRWSYFGTERLDIFWLAMAVEEMWENGLQQFWQINVSLTCKTDASNCHQVIDMSRHVRHCRRLHTRRRRLSEPLDNHLTALCAQTPHSLSTIAHLLCFLILFSELTTDQGQV